MGGQRIIGSPGDFYGDKGPQRKQVENFKNPVRFDPVCLCSAATWHALRLTRVRSQGEDITPSQATEQLVRAKSLVKFYAQESDLKLLSTEGFKLKEELMRLPEGITPGPGEYTLPPLLDPSKIGGGKISLAKVPGNVEMATREKAFLPGPGSYNVAGGGLSTVGVGRISEGNPKTVEEMILFNKRGEPGPGEYGTLASLASDELKGAIAGSLPGPNFSGGGIRDTADPRVAQQKGMPGPGAYGKGEAVQVKNT